MTFIPLLAQAVTQTVDPKTQQRVWLVTLILATLSAFLCLLVFLALMRMYRRGKQPKLAGAPTATASVWAAAGQRVPVDETRMPDGAWDPPQAPEDAGDEPFWDAEEEGDETWGEDEDGDDGDGDGESWR